MKKSNDGEAISSERKSVLQRRAANCADPFLAKELRRLADRFEQTADTAEDEKTPSDSSSERISH